MNYSIRFNIAAVLLILASPLAISAKENTKSIEQPAGSKWKVEKRTDSTGGSTTVEAKLNAEASKLDIFKKNYPFGTIITCKNNKMHMVFVFDGSAGQGDTKVKYKVGNNRSVKTKWTLKNNYITPNGDPTPIISQMLNAETFRFSFRSKYGSKVKFSFNLQHMTQAMKPLREACSW